MINDTEQQIEQIVQRFLAEIGEYADSVQVLASYMEPGGRSSFCYKKGTGNVYARIGMAREYLLQDQADTFSQQVWTTEGREFPE